MTLSTLTEYISQRLLESTMHTGDTRCGAEMGLKVGAVRMLWPGGSCWVLVGLETQVAACLSACDLRLARPCWPLSMLPFWCRNMWNTMQPWRSLFFHFWLGMSVTGPYALQNVVHPCGVHCTVHCTAGNGWCFLSLSVSISWCQVLEAMTEAGPQISPLPSLATCCCNLLVTCCNIL